MAKENKTQNSGYLYKNLENIDSIKLNKSPLQEYPRPQFKRDSYLCLNGEWDLKITKEKGITSEFDKKIIVPYAVESPLSGVNHLLEADEYLIYHRSVEIDKNFNKGNLILHFEGVDQTCEVYINNKFIGKHVGGYTSFFFDITEYISSNKFDIDVIVQDVTDESYHLKGKQCLRPEQPWFYSSSSGIYKTVWLESVPQKNLERVKYIPDYDNQCIDVIVFSQSEGVATFEVNGEKFSINTNEKTRVKPKDFHPWNLENPYLYDVKITFEKDVIYSYFGIRKIEAKKGKDNGFYLNNKRIFLNGLLDQGYYYLGGLTPISYDEFLLDIKNTKELGFNCLRKHVKVESDLFYYYADKYGLLVIQDFPNGGEKIKFLNVVIPRVSIKLFNKERFCTYKKYGRNDENGRNEFKIEAFEIVDTLYNHPSIVYITIFNEAWGEFDPSQMYKELKNYDNTHIYDTASGWLDSRNSDVFSIHVYTLSHRNRRDKKDGRPLIYTEVGGSALPVENHYYYPQVFGHGNSKNTSELCLNYKKLYENDLIPQIEKGYLKGIIYTQLNDCECECNGLYTLDRKVLKVDKEIITKINEKIYNSLK